MRRCELWMSTVIPTNFRALRNRRITQRHSTCLNDINCYYQLAGKLQSRLLNGVYQRDLPHKRMSSVQRSTVWRSGKTNFSPKESWSLTVQMVFCTRWNIKDTIAGTRWLEGLKAGVSKTFANTRCNCPGRRQNMPVLFISKEQYKSR